MAGNPAEAAPRKEFLASDRQFRNFALRLKYRLVCSRGCNSGVQFRSERVSNHHEVVGYQAVIAPGIHGAIYDETRRNRLLAVPSAEVQRQALAGAKDGWHDYVIRCEERRIRLWLNGIQMIAYTEPDESIACEDMIAL